MRNSGRPEDVDRVERELALTIPSIVTPRKVADLIGVSYSTVWRAIQDGRLTAVKRDTRLHVFRRDVAVWLVSQ